MSVVTGVSSVSSKAHPISSSMSGIAYGFSAKQIIEEGRVSEEQIDAIKSWLVNGNFPKLTEEQIVISLLSNCNEIEATKSTIRAYYSVTKSVPEVFDNRRTDREGIAKIIKTVEGCVITETRDDGSIIQVVRFFDTYYANLDLKQAMALFTMFSDASVYEYPPKGLVLIVDLQGIGLMHITRLRLKILKIFFQYIQEALPIRLVEMHVLNTVWFIDKLMAIVKPFMHQRVFDMLHFHPVNMDMKLFHEQWVPKRCLPEDYGGDLPPVRDLYQKHVEQLTDLHPFFKAEELQRHSVD